jgi:hypothetical protein
VTGTRPGATLPLLQPGHGRPRGRSPFGDAAPSIAAALVFAVATLVWLAVGDRLPGGRWLAVHLFTLGVLTNLVLTFSEHFTHAVTRTPGERAWWWPLLTNLGIVLVVLGRPLDHRWSLATGATIVMASVFAAYLRLRRMRTQAVGARFGWIVRSYERAHGAFLHGAILGIVLGVGWAPGSWYGGARLAHLHANILGWGGITLLATLVFFGPTMARTRIEPGADERAARAVRLGATGLTVSVIALFLTGLSGAGGTAARLTAAAGLGLLAWATAVVCLPVGRAAFRAKPTSPRWTIVAVCAWFPALVVTDAVVVAAGAWGWLDGLGLAALVGVLAQAILATLTYLAPMLRGRTTGDRDVVRVRLEVAAVPRVVAFQLGVLLLLVASTVGTGPFPAAAVGWVLLAGALLATAVQAGWPLPQPPPGHAPAGRGAADPEARPGS